MPQSIDQLHFLILNVGLAIHNADWNWEDVNSPFARIYYVTEGTAQITLPSGTYNLTPNHLYLIPSFVLHSYSCQAHFAHYYLHIYEDIHLESSILEDWEFPIEIPAGPSDLMLINRLCELNPTMKLSESDPITYDNKPTLIQNILKSKLRSFATKVESRGITYQLISLFLRNAKVKTKTEDVRIEKALSYIQKNIYNPIKIEQLSHLSCLSKDHFIRLFKKEMKSTPSQYITLKKIEKAQLMLITQDTPIKNIAYMLGYEDYSYFIRIFKRTVGITPQKYKKGTTHI